MRAKDFITSKLFEYDRSKTFDRFGSKLLSAADNDQSYNGKAADILAALETFDPTKEKKYTQWIAAQYANSRLKASEGNQVKRALSDFVTLQTQLKKLGRNTDINQYTWQQFKTMIASATETNLGSRLDSDTEILYDGVYGKLLVPKTTAAAIKWSGGTKWCTGGRLGAGDAANELGADIAMKEYGTLYIWIDRTGEKYQFHFDHEEKTGEIKNSSDKDLTPEEMEKLNNHPVVGKLLAREGADQLHIPLEIKKPKLPKLSQEEIEKQLKTEEERLRQQFSDLGDDGDELIDFGLSVLRNRLEKQGS